ncbi:hypothetical protein ACQ4PT_003277 [Festuca glaucescens]
MADQKRESSSSNEDWASKRLKGAANSTEKDYNVDTAASQETNGEKGDTSQKDSKGPMDPCISDEKSTAISIVPSQQEMILTSIEADAAEDKGCRHAMEDAWMNVKVAKKAIIEGFHRTDESLLQESTKGNWQDGATAVCVWVLGQMVVVANAGDAKAVLARSTSTDGEVAVVDTKSLLKAIVLTREHKAIFPQERSRIQKVFGPSDAVEFVQKQLKETSSATLAVRRLVKEAVRERRCKDNCTAVLIVFKH